MKQLKMNELKPGYIYADVHGKEFLYLGVVRHGCDFDRMSVDGLITKANTDKIKPMGYTFLELTPKRKADVLNYNKFGEWVEKVICNDKIKLSPSGLFDEYHLTGLKNSMSFKVFNEVGKMFDFTDLECQISNYADNPKTFTTTELIAARYTYCELRRKVIFEVLNKQSAIRYMVTTTARGKRDTIVFTTTNAKEAKKIMKEYQQNHPEYNVYIQKELSYEE